MRDCCEKPNERESVFMNPLQETLVMHVVFFFFAFGEQLKRGNLT